jgi:hypothetical protein
MKLNGWQRLGIIVSAIWLIAAPLTAKIAMNINANKMLESDLHTCDLAYQGAMNAYKDVQNCKDRWMKLDADASYRNIGLAGFGVIGIVPAMLGWLIAYGLIFLVRWVRQGFKPT